MDSTLYQKYVAEINRYATFKDGWAEIDSFAPKPEHIASALMVLSLWPQNLPMIVPMISYDGTVGFYVDTEDYYVDIEIEEKNTVSIYMRNRIKNNEDFFQDVGVNAELTEFLKDKMNLLLQN